MGLTIVSGGVIFGSLRLAVLVIAAGACHLWIIAVHSDNSFYRSKLVCVRCSLTPWFNR